MSTRAKVVGLSSRSDALARPARHKDPSPPRRCFGQGGRRSCPQRQDAASDDLPAWHDLAVQIQKRLYPSTGSNLVEKEGPTTAPTPSPVVPFDAETAIHIGRMAQTFHGVPDVFRGLILSNPCARPGKRYRSQRAQSIWLADDKAALKAVAPSHLWFAFLLAVWTGQRQGDLLRLTWTA